MLNIQLRFAFNDDDLSDAVNNKAKNEKDADLQFVDVSSKTKSKKYRQKEEYDALETPISTPDLQSAEIGNVDGFDDEYKLNLEEDVGNRSSDLGADDDDDDDDICGGMPVMTMKGKRRKSGVDDLDIMQFAQSFVYKEEEQRNFDENEVVSAEEKLENVKEKEEEVIAESNVQGQEKNDDDVDDEQNDDTKEAQNENESEKVEDVVEENDEEKAAENVDDK